MASLLDTIRVIDLESTCWEGPPPSEQISEIGLVTLDVATLERGEAAPTLRVSLCEPRFLWGKSGCGTVSTLPSAA